MTGRQRQERLEALGVNVHYLPETDKIDQEWLREVLVLLGLKERSFLVAEHELFNEYEDAWIMP